MMKDPLYERMRELSWRRKLSHSEETQLREWLSAHPEAQDEWESETRLNEALACLPAAPVASNFTERVLRAVELEDRARRPWAVMTSSASAWWVRFLPRVAIASVVFGAGWLSYNHLQATRRAECAASLAAISHVASLPSPEILEDFDAIAALNPTPPADEELLKLLQ